jgi:hypothetical protein
MSRCLTVVAFVLIALTGAMGLRNIVGSTATLSASNHSTPSVWAIGPGPVPGGPDGPGHIGPGPVPGGPDGPGHIGPGPVPGGPNGPGH